MKVGALSIPEAVERARVAREAIGPDVKLSLDANRWGKIYHHTLTLNRDGTVSPPEVPGIGVDPNYEVLAPYRVA